MEELLLFTSSNPTKEIAPSCKLCQTGPGCNPDHAFGKQTHFRNRIRKVKPRIAVAMAPAPTCVTRNFVIRSGSLLFSLDRIISNMSPWSFSMTTKTLSGVSNMHSRFTMPGWCRFWEEEEVLVKPGTLTFCGNHLHSF